MVGWVVCVFGGLVESEYIFRLPDLVRIPTKNLCILLPAPLWHLICTNFFLLFGKIELHLRKFSIIIWRINAGIAPFILICAICDEFSTHHHQQQSIKKLHIQYQIGTISMKIKLILVRRSGIFGIIWFITSQMRKHT